MTCACENPGLGRDLPAGSDHYRAFVGPPQNYDLMSANQFNLLTLMGLREEHSLLDVGCGSLRGGRLFIPYLLPGRYFGLEPNRWLVEEGVRNELGDDLVRLKQPTFLHEEDFNLSAFGRQFDFLLAQSIFSHAAPRQIARCLDQAKRVMKPGALFLANYQKGASDYGGLDWVYPGCCDYTPAGMERMVQEHGLRCRPVAWFHPNDLAWLVIYHPEAESSVPELSDSPRASAIEAQFRGAEARRQRSESRLSTLKSKRLVRLAIKLDRWFARNHEREGR